MTNQPSLPKVRVDICVGTYCHVVGGAELLVIPEMLDETLMDKVDIRGAMCVEHCKEVGGKKAPFAVVDGELVVEATVEKLLGIIRARVAAVENSNHEK